MSSYVPPYLAGVQPAILSTNHINATTNTVSGGGTLVLDNLSQQTQVITGTAAHTVRLPTETTLVRGQSFTVTNNSTDLVTVKSSNTTVSALNLISILPPGKSHTLTCRDNTVNTIDAWTGGNIITTILPGVGRQMCFDGTYLWVVDQTSNSITKHLPSTGEIVQTITVGFNPFGMCFDGTNVWICNSQNPSGSVTKILASTGAILGTFIVGANPTDMCFDGTHIWVIIPPAGNVVKLLASTGAIVGTYSVGSTPSSICFDGTNIWVVVNIANVVKKILASTGAILGTFAIGAGPQGVRFDGTYIWICNQNDNTLTKILASTGAVIATIATSSPFPRQLCFDGTYLWVIASLSVSLGAPPVLLKILASTGTTVGTYSVTYNATYPFYDGTNIWVTGNVLTKIPPSAGVPQSAQLGIAFNSSFNNVSRDIYAGAAINNVIPSYQSTITSAGIKTMSVLSGYLQYFTGTTTHTVLLPPVSTLSNGSGYKLVNLSTGAVTVQTSTGSAVYVLTQATGSSNWATFTCVDITGATGIGGWSVEADYTTSSIIGLNYPNNYYAAAAGVPIGGLYRSNIVASGSPDTVYIRTV